MKKKQITETLYYLKLLKKHSLTYSPNKFVQPEIQRGIDKAISSSIEVFGEMLDFLKEKEEQQYKEIVEVLE